MEVLSAVLGGEWGAVRVSDPLGRAVEARYVVLPGGLAVVEAAEAIGLWRLAPEELDPLRASSRGLGELMLSVLIDARPEALLVCLGGVATVDGGVRERVRYLVGAADAQPRARVRRHGGHVGAGEQTRPAVGATSPVIRLNIVDLPAPFGPITPRASPSSTVRLTVVYGFERAIEFGHAVELQKNRHEGLSADAAARKARRRLFPTRSIRNT